MPAESDRLGPNETEVAAAVLGGEAVLINLSSGVYYSMSGVAAVVWELIALHYTEAEMIPVLKGLYGVEERRLQGDLRSLMGQLMEENLILAKQNYQRNGDYSPADGNSPAVYQSPRLEVYRDMKDLLALDPPMPDLEDIPWQPEAED